jgi:predicted RNA methylase
MGIIYSTKPLQARKKLDHYPTPSGLVRASLGLPQINPSPIKILDPGAGTGVWGSIARGRWSESFITGVETQPCPPNGKYDIWYSGDFFRWSAANARERYDLIIGNPPYGGICKDMAEILAQVGKSFFFCGRHFSKVSAVDRISLSTIVRQTCFSA